MKVWIFFLISVLSQASATNSTQDVLCEGMKHLSKKFYNFLPTDGVYVNEKALKTAQEIIDDLADPNNIDVNRKATKTDRQAFDAMVCTCAWVLRKDPKDPDYKTYIPKTTKVSVNTNSVNDALAFYYVFWKKNLETRNSLCRKTIFDYAEKNDSEAILDFQEKLKQVRLLDLNEKIASQIKNCQLTWINDHNLAEPYEAAFLSDEQFRKIIWCDIGTPTSDSSRGYDTVDILFVDPARTNWQVSDGFFLTAAACAIDHKDTIHGIMEKTTTLALGQIDSQAQETAEKAMKIYKKGYRYLCKALCLGGSHYNLLVIDTGNAKIQILDSLSAVWSVDETFLEELKKKLDQILNKNFVIERFALNNQTEGYNCGRFACYYADIIIREGELGIQKLMHEAAEDKSKQIILDYNQKILDYSKALSDKNLTRDPNDLDWSPCINLP
jgi:hypothetical protein